MIKLKSCGKIPFMINAVDAYILAGGKSERMKTNKALLGWRGSTILEELNNNLKQVFSQVFVVVKGHQLQNRNGFNFVFDEHSNYCPLVGVLAALKHTDKPRVFIKACDNPLFSKRLVEKMHEISERYDIVVPKTHDGYHPLFGFYSKKCLNTIEEMIKNEDYRIINIYDKVNTFFVDDKFVVEFDKEGVSLKNLNTPQDFCDFKKRFEGVKDV